MTGSFVRLVRCAGAAALLSGAVQSLAAQGISSGAVIGRLVDDAGGPIASANVTLVSKESGRRYSARSDEEGRFAIENVQVGPYVVQALALGFDPYESAPFDVTLGQRFIHNATMKRTAVTVEAVTVVGEEDRLMSTNKTGASTFISDEALRRLPTLNRSFDSFISTAPQVVGRSVTGQNDRFNNIQIDGTVNNDLFALGSSNGTPGGAVNARPISLEAVKEYQVLVAPFDVRQGGFVGGLINAVTKSGTNAFHGSVFGTFQNESFLGTDTAGVSVPVNTFAQQQYGFTVGGPIIRDRMHFFVAADIRNDLRPFASSIQIGPDPNNPADTAGVGITQGRADSVQSILLNTYGIDAGSWRAPDITNPELNLFAKLDFQLATNSHLEASVISVGADRNTLIHSYTAPFNGRDGYQLSNSGYLIDNTTRTVRGKWSATFGAQATNELILGHSTITDERTPQTSAPLILVTGNTVGTYLAAGGERFSQANFLDQSVFELTDNLTLSLGRHLVTVGTHNEFFSFRNVFFPASIGIWNFSSPDSLEQGLANRFERALPTAARPDGPVSDFSVKQFGFYAEDRFSPLPNLTVSLGLRMDVPIMPAPAFNPALDTVSFPALNGGGVNTSLSPSGNPLWSPRLGFNYDVGGRRHTILRGGIGVFSGRPPYVWVSNAFGNTGMEQQTLICTGAAAIPAFTVDPAAQPTQCANGTGPSAAATAIVFYDENFKFPQAMKVALGFDQELGWDVVGTIDFIYTKAINQFYLVDVNLRGIQGSAAGEGGRPMYGTMNPATGAATVLRVTPLAAGTIQNVNRNSDQSTSLTFQLRKRFGTGLEFSGAYTYSHSLDLITMTSDITGSNYNFATLDGTVANRNLRNSGFDRPHKITVVGAADAPLGTRFSLLYNGISGFPFSYVVANDANADGVGANDPVYVPRDASDITLSNPADWATLDSYIRNEPCLNKYRGSILPRNVCRNSWINRVDARVSKVFTMFGGHGLEVMADMLNVLNFLNSDWGLIRQTATFEETNLLRLNGYDATRQRGRYILNLPTRKNGVQLNSIASRWVFQLGARYTF